MKKWRVSDYFNKEDLFNEDNQLCGIEYSCKICGFTFIEYPTTNPILTRNYSVSIISGMGICEEPERAEDHIMKYHIKEL